MLEIVNFPKIIETIAIFWSLFFQNLVLMVLNIKEVLIRWYCSRCILMKYVFRVVYYFCGSMSLCKDRTVHCYECIGCPASELIGCNIFFCTDKWNTAGVFTRYRNPTIFNIIRWVDESMGQTTHWPSVWCFKYYFFS